MKWIGPYVICDLLTAKDSGQPRPADTHGIYLVSGKKWAGSPGKDCDPLYVGGLTGTTRGLRTRIGDLLADLLGFYGDHRGHSSGGKSIDCYCDRAKRKRTTLWIGWADEVGCYRCAEISAFDELMPRLNRSRPPKCFVHKKEAKWHPPK